MSRMFDKIVLCLCITTSITEIAAYWRRDNKSSTLKLSDLFLEKKKECKLLKFNLIDLLNFFFSLPSFSFFSCKKLGKFQISKIDKFLKEVVVKYNSPEAAPLSNKS